MTNNAKALFFDSIADRWDGWDDLDSLAARLDLGLDELGVTCDESILDVGCGTGNLTRALLSKLSAKGRVAAADISPKMIAVAQSKIQDPRVAWYETDAARIPLASETFHRIICYSVWPHFDDKKEAALELFRLLSRGGSLHIWHLMSRHAINEIHASASPAVHDDILPKAEDTADLLTSCGFRVVACDDGAERYLVTAIKPFP